jgi:hypothetical protein
MYVPGTTEKANLPFASLVAIGNGEAPGLQIAIAIGTPEIGVAAA